jgi:alpha-beta hydrolase superfamily lysophospholipase
MRIESYLAKDGSRLYFRHNQRGASSRASIVILHGIISHSGWYYRLAEHLMNRAYDVSSLDRRGSGLNIGQRGDIDSYQTWVTDVIGYLESLPRDRPLVLLGISWGGKLAPWIATLRPDLLAAVGMLCPGLYARQQPGWLKRAYVAGCVKLGRGDRRVAIPLRKPELFTDHPEWREFIRHDPLTLREITLRFACEDRKLTKLARRCGPMLRTPSLLVTADRDRIVNNTQTRSYHLQAPSLTRTTLAYPSGNHTLEFESDPIHFFHDLTAWLDRVTSLVPVGSK